MEIRLGGSLIYCLTRRPIKAICKEKKNVFVVIAGQT